MIKTYKYWIFYIKSDYVHDVYKELYHHIYAYTDTKKYAAEFELMHDMKKFIKKEVRLVRQEVRLLTQHARNEFLQPFWLTTISEDYCIDEMELILTEGEQRLLHANVSNLVNNTLIRATIGEPFIFNKKIYNALHELKYVLLHSGVEVDDSFMKGTLHIDEVAVYIDIFADILQPNKKGDD